MQNLPKPSPRQTQILAKYDLANIETPRQKKALLAPLKHKNKEPLHTHRSNNKENKLSCGCNKQIEIFILKCFLLIEIFYKGNTEERLKEAS